MPDFPLMCEQHFFVILPPALFYFCGCDTKPKNIDLIIFNVDKINAAV